MGFFSRLNHRRGRPRFLVIRKRPVVLEPRAEVRGKRLEENSMDYRFHYAASPQEGPVSTSTMEGTSSFTALAMTFAASCASSRLLTDNAISS